MKKIVAAFAAVAMTGTLLVVPTIGVEAATTQSGTYSCEARSPSAIGRWIHTDLNYACRRAQQECAVRTPYYQTCYVTRYWYNY